MPDPIIIDLSHHNPEPDWGKLAASGLVGVIMKATEGTGYIDPTFARRREAAKAAGLAVSTYHFLKHGNVGQQMLNYLDTVGPWQGERMVIDHEDAAVTLDDLKQAVQALFDQPLNLQVTVYSGHTIKDQLGSKTDALLAKTSLWIAQYTSAASPSWPSGTWPTWTLWQYTDKASVPGISQPVDGNRFNGSNENALKWLAPASEAPPPVPAPVLEAVVVDITTPPGVEVRVMVNGQMAA